MLGHQTRQARSDRSLYTAVGTAKEERDFTSEEDSSLSDSDRDLRASKFKVKSNGLQRADTMSRGVGLNVGDRTARKYVRKCGMRYLARPKVPYMTKIHMKNRKKWCTSMMKMTPDFGIESSGRTRPWYACSTHMVRQRPGLPRSLNTQESAPDHEPTRCCNGGESVPFTLITDSMPNINSRMQCSISLEGRPLRSGDKLRNLTVVRTCCRNFCNIPFF